MATSELFQKLKALGAGEFAHLNGSLEAHLIGTESLLRGFCALTVANETQIAAASRPAELYPLGLTEARLGELLEQDSQWSRFPPHPQLQRGAA